MKYGFHFNYDVDRPHMNVVDIRVYCQVPTDCRSYIKIKLKDVHGTK